MFACCPPFNSTLFILFFFLRYHTCWHNICLIRILYYHTCCHNIYLIRILQYHTFFTYIFALAPVPTHFYFYFFFFFLLYTLQTDRQTRSSWLRVYMHLGNQFLANSLYFSFDKCSPYYTLYIHKCSPYYTLYIHLASC